MLAIAIVLLLVAAAALACAWVKKMQGWAGPLGIVGTACAIYGVCFGLISGVHHLQEDRLEALESRYDLDIDPASVSYTGEPEPWRINGKWYTCYLDERASKNDTRDLLCATTPALDFKPADAL